MMSDKLCVTPSCSLRVTSSPAIYISHPYKILHYLIVQKRVEVYSPKELFLCLIIC